MKRTLAALAAGVVLGGTGSAVAAFHVIAVGYGVGCYKDVNHRAIICTGSAKHATLGVAISNQLAAVIDLKDGKTLYQAKQR